MTGQLPQEKLEIQLQELRRENEHLKLMLKATSLLPRAKNFEELIQSRTRYDLAVNATKEGIWDWNLETNEAYLSSRWCDIIGYSDEDPELPHTFDSWASRIHLDDYDRVMSSVKAHLEEKKPFDVKYRHRHKSGQYRWQQSRGSAVLNESGKPIRMVGSIRDIHDEQLIYLKLKENEEKFRLVFHTSPDSISINQLETGEYVEINKAFERITGFSRGEVVGKSSLELNIWKNPDDRMRFVEKLNMDGFANDFAAEYLTKDGTVIQAVKFASILTINGKKVILSIARDVTERKKAEQQLRQSAENLNIIFDSAPNILALVDEDLRVEMINLKGATLVKRQRAQISGMLCGDVFRCQNSLHDNGCGKNPECSECPIRTRVTSTYKTKRAYVEEQGRMTFISDGLKDCFHFLISTTLLGINDTERVLLSLVDISALKKVEQELVSYKDKLEDIVKERTLELRYANESLEEEVRLRKEAESLLEKSQARLINAIETIDDGFVLYDADDRLVLCNKKYKDLYHESNDLMTPGKTFEEIIRKGAERGEYSEAAGRVDDWVNERLSLHRRANSNVEQQLSDGTWLKINERRMENGDTVGFRVDITRYKQTEDALRKIQEGLEHRVKEEVGARLALEQEQRQMALRMEQSQKMETIGTLAGGIAHDFNNILFPILGHSELLLEEIPANTPAHDSLNQIRSSGLRAKELVQQILSFSRQEKTEYRPLKVQLILKEVIKFLRSTIPKNIELSQHIDPECGLVMADATQIHQIIMNLTTNACHAMENRGGHLRVTLKEVSLTEGLPQEAGNFACLSVSDTGIGMSPETLNRVFEPYFTTKVKGKGTGIGLSVVHSIVQKMKGFIKVQSGEGKGSEFKMYFPIEQSKKCESREQTPIHKLPMGNERILLVDDEKPITDLQGQILERLGYSVSKFTSSLAALDAFKASPEAYDLVISDLSMPQMTGDRLASEILKIKPEALIIICTGFSESITIEKARHIGIKGLLMKPLVKADIAKEVRNVLDLLECKTS